MPPVGPAAAFAFLGHVPHLRTLRFHTQTWRPSLPASKPCLPQAAFPHAARSAAEQLVWVLDQPELLTVTPSFLARPPQACEFATPCALSPGVLNCLCIQVTWGASRKPRPIAQSLWAARLAGGSKVREGQEPQPPPGTATGRKF